MGSKNFDKWAKSFFDRQIKIRQMGESEFTKTQQDARLRVYSHRASTTASPLVEGLD